MTHAAGSISSSLRFDTVLTFAVRLVVGLAVGDFLPDEGFDENPVASPVGKSAAHATGRERGF